MNSGFVLVSIFTCDNQAVYTKHNLNRDKAHESSELDSLQGLWYEREGEEQVQRVVKPLYSQMLKITRLTVMI